MPPLDRREIPGYPGYFIDTDGAVWSAYPGGQCYHAAKRRAPIRLKQCPTSRGYLAVGLYRDGKASTKHVHRLVALTFLGPPPSDRPHARHLDGNILNNSLTNIAWGTQVENEGDKRRHGTIQRGERHVCSPLRESDVRTIRERSAAGEGDTAISRDYGVTRRAVWAIVQRRTWRHVL